MHVIFHKKRACGHLFSRKQGLGPQNTPVQKKLFFVNNKKVPAAACSAVNSCWGYQPYKSGITINKHLISYDIGIK